MTMSTIGIIIVIAYSAILIGISVWSGKHNKISSGKEFFLGKGVGLFVLLFSLLAACFSTWVFMGCPTTTYNQGWQWVALVTMYQMTFCFTCGYFGPRFWKLSRAHNFVTHGDLVASYFNGSKLCRYFIAIGFLAGTFSISIAQFRAIGNAVTAVTGVSYEAVVVFIAAVIMIYVCLGGYHGTALIDTFQGLLFTFILIGGFVIVVFKMGGLAPLFNEVAAADSRLILFNSNSSDTLWPTQTAISFSIVGIFAGVITPSFWTRYYTADSPRTLTRMSVRQPILTGVIVTTMGGLIGLSAHAFVARGSAVITDPSIVLQELMSQISFPAWPLLVVLGCMAAGMSTIAGNLNIGAMAMTYDFVHHIRKDLTEQQLVKVARGSVLILDVLVAYASINTTDAITDIIQIGGGFNCLAVFPVFGIFFWKRATTEGTVAAMVASLAAQVYTLFVRPNALGLTSGFWGLLVGTLVFVLVSLCTKPVSAEHRAQWMAPLSNSKVFSHTRTD